MTLTLEHFPGSRVKAELERSKIKDKRTKKETVASVQIKTKMKQNNVGITNAEVGQ